MNVTICSVFTAVVFSFLFYGMSRLLKTRVSLSNSLYIRTALTVMCLLRLLIMAELPFAVALPSYSVLPLLMIGLRYKLFALFGVAVTAERLLLFVWGAGSVILLLRLWIRAAIEKREVLALKTVHNPVIEQLLNEIVGTTKPGKPYRLRISDEVDMPMLRGFGTPVLCIPELSLTNAGYLYVLRHEWAHYLLKHMWIKLAVSVLKTLFWWNPLVYFVQKEVDRLLEIHCDAYLASKMNASERIAYLDTTLKVIKQLNAKRLRKPVFTYGLLGSGRRSDIEERFRAVLEYGKPRNLRKISTVVMLLAALFMLSYGVAVRPV